MHNSDTMMYDRNLVQDDLADDDLKTKRTVILYTAASAISIASNFLLFFLISRKKHYLDEETKQPTYYRIIFILAISSLCNAGNVFVAARNGSMADILTMPEVSEYNGDISFSCYVQSFVDIFSYIIYLLGSVWLCLYFLLRIYHGVAKISPITEVLAYGIIVLFGLGDCDALYMHGAVGPNSFFGICTVNVQDNSFSSATIFVTVIGGTFLTGIFAMILIIFKTFRDEQEINQLSSTSLTMNNKEQQQQSLRETSQTHFEATKDITMQAFVFVLFLFGSFGSDIFFQNQSRRLYMTLYLLKGLYLLVFYLYFEIRIITKQYTNISNLAAFKAIITDSEYIEVLPSEEVLTEETPLVPDSNRCVIADITILVKDENKEEVDVEDDLYVQIMQEIEQEASNGGSSVTSRMSYIVNEYLDAFKKYLAATEN